MDTAGACVACGESIAASFQRFECAHCHAVLHRDCVPGDECPRCHQPLGLDAAGPSESTIEHRDLSQVRGWLLVLIVICAINGVFGVVSGALLLLDSSAAMRAWGLGTLCVGVYGGLCSRLLWLRANNAPRHTAGYLVAAIAMSLWAAALATIRDETTAGLGRGIIPAILWLVYLARSRRVTAVYGRRAN